MHASILNKRKRLTQACDCCRRMKVRCDTDKPACATCRRLDVPCTFLTGNKKRGPRQSSASISYTTGGIPGHGAIKYDSGKISQLLSNPQSNPATGSGNMDSPAKVSTSKVVHGSTEQDLSTLVPQDENSTEGQEVVEQSDKFYSLPFPKQYFPYYRDAEEDLQEDQGKDHQHIRSTLDGSCAVNPEMLLLIDYYFSYIHHQYPFVHPQEFREKLRKAQVSPLLINSICALASRYRASSTKELHDPSYAEKIESQVFCVIEEPTLESSQALLHMCIYELACGQINRACTYSGVVIRMAQKLGYFRLDELHTGVSNLTVKQWVQKETARRIWWFSYIFDTYVSIAISRPPLINEDDCSIVLPCIDHYWEECKPIDTQVCNFDQELPKQVVTMITAPNVGLLAIHVAMVAIMARTNRVIMRFETLTGSQKDYIFPQIKHALGAWEANLPEQFKYRPEETIKGDPSAFAQIAFLDSMRHAMDIWIHLPVLQNPVPTGKTTPKAPGVAESVKRCFMSAKMIAFAVKEVRGVSVLETDPMYSICIFMAARFFLQGCRSKNDYQAQRSLKFYKFLHNALVEWKVLWGVIDIHFSILDKCYSRINAKPPKPTNTIDDGYNSTAPASSLLTEEPSSNLSQDISSSCNLFGQNLNTSQEFNDMIMQALAQNQFQQLDDNYYLQSKTLDEQYPSIWGACNLAQPQLHLYSSLASFPNPERYSPPTAYFSPNYISAPNTSQSIQFG
ncbi:hypothetical protein K7432_003456 [Basidiobolus ranarum]|uniref:Zn(2)-C6 fungal-type domain-containing protein n=1 Tax=Basidiobolus ranarum TaxID=34480 RepID=A0ABR2W689_9FUNG